MGARFRQRRLRKLDAAESENINAGEIDTSAVNFSETKLDLALEAVISSRKGEPSFEAPAEEIGLPRLSAAALSRRSDLECGASRAIGRDDMFGTSHRVMSATV